MADGSKPTITEFLLARISEDEARANAASESMDAFTRDHWMWLGGYDVEVTPENYAYIDHLPPARVLAECKAKRAIVGVHTCAEGGMEIWLSAPDLPDWPGFIPGYYSRDACLCCSDLALDVDDSRRWPCRTLHALASVYADHPDYREEWACAT